MGEPTRRTIGPAGTSVLAVLGAVTLVLLVLVWGSSRISPALRDDGIRVGEAERSVRVPERPAPSGSESSTAPDDRDEQPPPVRRDPPAWVRLLIVAIELALVGAVLIGLLGLVRRIRLHRLAKPRRTPGAPTPDFDVLTRPAAVASSIAEDAAEQRRLLATGAPANGIVACWDRFEHQAGSVGLGRHPWETSSEFTLRVLDLVEADEAAVHRLAGLYREARHSDHEMVEAQRAAAAEALATIHATLRLPAGQRTPAGGWDR